MGYMRCLYGGAQYKKGTDLWATERKGMINAPDFGRVLAKDRFIRINRYLQVSKQPLPPPPRHDFLPTLPLADGSRGD